MSIRSINGVSPATPQTDEPQAITPAPAVTPFSQQLDAQTAQQGPAHAQHHHHLGEASRSVISSAATAASVAGVAPPVALAASVLNLLS